VLDRLTRYKRLEQYPEDKELLDDVIVENRQAIEMTTIYRDIINGTRELMSSLLDNRLNNVMKYLTSITIVMAIPTVISGIYGMNVNENWMPFVHDISRKKAYVIFRIYLKTTYTFYLKNFCLSLLNGMEIADKILAKNLHSEIIFVSNHEEMVFESFRYKPAL